MLPKALVLAVVLTVSVVPVTSSLAKEVEEDSEGGER